MFAYELLPKLRHLTLTVENDEEYWEEKLVFVGSQKQWQIAFIEEVNLFSV